MSGVCHIVCAGPGEVALLAEHDDGDGGVAAERFPYEPKAPVTLSCEHRTMSAATTPPSPSPVKPGDFLIAVDGGFAQCLAAGLEPDLFVGDLDSLSPELVSLIGCERIELPCEKDDTDTVYACKEGLARGYESFVLHCALGGDVGHELANIQTLAFLRERGARGMLLGGSQQVHLVTPDASPASFAAPPGTRVSVFSFGDAAHGVIERGLQWELEDAAFTNAMPLGVSNVTTHERFEIGVRDGMLLVVIG